MITHKRASPIFKETVRISSDVLGKLIAELITRQNDT